MATMKSLTIGGVTYDIFGSNVTVLPGAFFDAVPKELFSLSTTEKNIPMKEVAQYGDYFGVVDGTITCLKSCVVEVSFHFYVSGASSGDALVAAVKCPSDGAKTLFCNYVVQSNGHSCFSGCRCMPFYSGDVIEFVGQNNTASRGSIANWNESNTLVHLRVLYDLPDAE